MRARREHRGIATLWIVLLAVLAGWAAGARYAPPAPAASTGPVYLPLVLSAGRARQFLPLALGNYPPPAGVFGAQIATGLVTATVARASSAGLTWIRYDNLLWSEVEPQRGARNWAKLGGFEAEVLKLRAHGLTPIAIVRGTPAWAQKVAGASCGPILETALDDFADFMYEAVRRYSAPPYNITYWEMWNEPDVDPALVAPSSDFGCWGDAADASYGGGYFAEMLKRVYPAIKSADARAQVVLGGLLLDCDPTQPPPGRDCRPGNFLEGILQNGGGNAFDIVGYHAYLYWDASGQDWDLNQAYWQHRGGSVLGKLDFIRSILAQHGLTKPVLLTESGLLCYPGYAECPGDAFYESQANYVVRLYTRSWANGLLGTLWFTLNGPGWRASGLLDSDQNPRPAYAALRFMAGLLAGASYDGPLSDPGTEGYRFHQGDREYRVYWTNDATTVNVLPPPGTLAVYDRYGHRLPGGGAIPVSFDPVFVEIRAGTRISR